MIMASFVTFIPGSCGGSMFCPFFFPEGLKMKNELVPVAK